MASHQGIGDLVERSVAAKHTDAVIVRIIHNILAAVSDTLRYVHVYRMAVFAKDVYGVKHLVLRVPQTAAGIDYHKNFHTDNSTNAAYV